MSTTTNTAVYPELAVVAEILDGLDAKIKRLKAQLDDTMHDPLTELKRAKNHYRSRRAREAIFANEKLFGEPAWDMLIDLFIAHEEEKWISVSSLCIASCVPDTTALRWIAILENAGLVYRTPDPNDTRRIFLALTEIGLLRAKTYFEQCPD